MYILKLRLIVYSLFRIIEERKSVIESEGNYEKRGLFFWRMWSFRKKLLGLGILSAVLAVVFWTKGGHLSLLSDEFNFSTNNVCLFFLLLSLISFISDFCVNKICRDIATLLKEIEDK